MGTAQSMCHQPAHPCPRLDHPRLHIKEGLHSPDSLVRFLEVPVEHSESGMTARKGHGCLPPLSEVLPPETRREQASFSDLISKMHPVVLPNGEVAILSRDQENANLEFDSND